MHFCEIKWSWLYIANKIVQILHIHSSHWVVISNVHCTGDDLSIYYTIFDGICTSTMALVSSMFKENVNISIVPQLQKQEEDVDCGAFSIPVPLHCYMVYLLAIYYAVKNCGYFLQNRYWLVL